MAAMEDVLDLYQEPYDPQRPIVCFDESPYQLIEEVRDPMEAKPGSTMKYDVEYKRNGVRNLLMICEPLQGTRNVLVTEHRTKKDFAHAMKHLSEMYPSASSIRVVLDNLNTHKKGSLYETFTPEEANAIAKRLEFHYTPKHGSWLNIAELEFAVLSKTCLDQRIPDEAMLKREVAANVAERNARAHQVQWKFSSKDARKKLQRLYPSISG